MATTTGTMVLYKKAMEYMSDGTMDMDGDTFKIQLHTSAYTPSATTHTVRADLTNELSTANGYTAGGYTLVSPTFSESGGTLTFDAADPVWTASGGSIVAHYFVIYDDTPAAPLDPLIAYGFLDQTPADVTTTDTNTLTIQLNASGIFTATAA